MAHVMLDLETWGVLPGCALRSIGACVFDTITGQIGETFYRNIDDGSCAKVGLLKEPGTVKFWSEQSEAARDAFRHDAVPLGTALLDFGAWFRKVNAHQLWAHGANFDPPILEAAHEAVMLPIPWQFWNVRCCRTVLALGGRRPERVKGDTLHHALDDATAQAKAVATVFRGGSFLPS